MNSSQMLNWARKWSVIEFMLKKISKYILIILIVVLVVKLGSMFIQSRGWYDNSQGPSENYQRALDNKDVSLASLYDFQFNVNGYYFTVPMRYGDIRDWGFYDYPGTDYLEAKESLMMGSWFIMGEPNEEALNPISGRTSIWAAVRNYKDEQAKIEDCTIVEMKVGRFKEEGNFEVVLPKGLKIGEATTEDVKKAYGRPKYEEKEPITKNDVFKYEMNNSASKSYVIIYFDSNKIIKTVEFSNHRENYGPEFVK